MTREIKLGEASHSVEKSWFRMVELSIWYPSLITNHETVYAAMYETVKEYDEKQLDG
jgi:hypothetical protein